MPPSIRICIHIEDKDDNRITMDGDIKKIDPGKRTKKVIGWRERVNLPELGVKSINAKIDTGAKTSALHAFDMKRKKKRGKRYLEFKIHPIQRSSEGEKRCRAEVIDERIIKSSVGHKTVRPVIITPIKIGSETWPIEITLVNRDVMGYRMLLGRQAIKKLFLVNPGKSYLLSTNKKKR